ncbi:MAG: thioredoxin family protein [Flavobacteriaceae bacterium]|nr:thioredoxin family protein [Flavobacteriaceae bacterium]
MRIFIYSLLIALSIFACKNDKKNANDYAYLGGEIINPSTNFVVILKSESVIDTIKLDNHNRFIYKINDLNPGFYTFKHGSEIQMVLLEPNDSIMLRLNTLDFDESLVYSGEGSKKNNYFINEFLQNEIIEKEIFQLCQLNPVDFENKINQIKAKKNKVLKEFINDNLTSDLFNEIAEANINYSYYSSKEIYPIINYSSSKRHIIDDLPKGFYDYRKNVDYNNEGYQDYLTYNSFLRTNFNNLALEKHLNHSHENHFNSKSICYNLDRLKLIDSLVSNHSIKNDLLYYFTMSFLTKNKDIEKNDVLTKLFLSKSTNEKNNEIISNLTQSLNNLKPGELFPNIKLVNSENSDLNFNSIITKPTAIYFWSHNFYDHFKESHYKVNDLKEKYPEIEFIAVNIDDSNLKTWESNLNKNNFSLINEYQFKNPKESMHTLAIYPMTKVIIIDKNNIIVNSNSNMFSSNFEEQLLGLINK